MTTSAEGLLIERGELRLEVALRPFSFTIRRAGRRMIRDGGVWVTEGTVHDLFIQLTEGIIPREERSPKERSRRATVVAHRWDQMGWLQ